MILSKVYNNVQINKKAKAGQNVNSDNKAVLTMSASSYIFVCELLVLSQLTTISIYIENSWTWKKN